MDIKTAAAAVGNHPGKAAMRRSSWKIDRVFAANAGDRIVFIANGKEWRPQADDLIAEDWEVEPTAWKSTEPSVLAAKIEKGVFPPEPLNAKLFRALYPHLDSILFGLLSVIAAESAAILSSLCSRE